MRLTASLACRALRWIVVAWIVFASIGVAQPGAAQSDSPSDTAEAVRSALFEAQGALLNDEVPTAVASAGRARTATQPLLDALPAGSGAAVRLSEGFDDAAAASESGNAAALAFARSKIWTAVLAGALDQTIEAIQVGDVETAKSWLLVREFRPSTKFSRPDANATLALRAL